MSWLPCVRQVPELIMAFGLKVMVHSQEEVPVQEAAEKSESGSLSDALKKASSWAQVTPIRQLAGRVDFIEPLIVTFEVVLMSALKVIVPVALRPLTLEVAPGQSALATDPGAQESWISQVPTTLPPHGVNAPQLPALSSSPQDPASSAADSPTIHTRFVFMPAS